MLYKPLIDNPVWDGLVNTQWLGGGEQHGDSATLPLAGPGVLPSLLSNLRPSIETNLGEWITGK